MEIILYVLIDVLHLIKIFLFCDLIFMFHKRENSKLRYIVLLGCMIFLSVWFYLDTVNFFTFAINTIALCIVICVIYDEKIKELIFSSLWIWFLISMLDLISTEFVDVIFILFHKNNAKVEEFCASIISLIFIFIVGKLYSNKYKIGIKKVGLVKLFCFTILAIADTYVVMIMTGLAINKSIGTHKVGYIISVLIAIIGIFIQLASVILLIISRDTYKEKEEITGKYLNEQIKHYKYLEQREKETKKFRHDIKSHMQVLSSMAKNDMYSNFDEYMKDINIKIDSFGNVITVNNGIVDAIVNKYYSEATQKGIDIVIKGMFPKNCKISAYDLCTIFSNLLSNAIEAAEKSVEKRISMECRYTKESIIVITKNTFKDEGQFRHSKIITTKKDIEYHGFGIENIKDAVIRNNGMIDIDIENSIYSITVMLANQEVES